MHTYDITLEEVRYQPIDNLVKPVYTGQGF